MTTDPESAASDEGRVARSEPVTSEAAGSHPVNPVTHLSKRSGADSRRGKGLSSLGADPKIWRVGVR